MSVNIKFVVKSSFELFIKSSIVFELALDLILKVNYVCNYVMRRA